jgi:hypothetical protein
MNFLNQAKEQLSSGSNNTDTQQQGGQAAGQNTNNAGSEDYGDKGMSSFLLTFSPYLDTHIFIACLCSASLIVFGLMPQQG